MFIGFAGCNNTPGPSTSDGNTSTTAGNTSTTVAPTTAAPTGESTADSDETETSESTTLDTEGSTQTDATTEDTTESTSTTSTFIGNVDLSDDYACDILDPSTCPAGQKCMPYNNDGGATYNALKCVDVMGEAVHGEACTYNGSPLDGADTCAQGHMCWNYDPDTQEGTCTAFCSGSWEDLMCAPEGTSCVVYADAILIMCLQRCDVLVQDCEPGFGCYHEENTNRLLCQPVGVMEGEGLEGEPCNFINQCQPGLVCMGNWPMCDGAYCCAPYCDLDNPVCNTPGTECVPLLDNPEPGEENFGICMAT